MSIKTHFKVSDEIKFQKNCVNTNLMPRSGIDNLCIHNNKCKLIGKKSAVCKMHLSTKMVMPH